MRSDNVAMGVPNLWSKPKVLKQRVMTALVIAPVILLAIFCLPQLGFIAAITVLLAWMSWEWGFLAGLERPLPRIIYISVVLALAVLVWRYIGVWFWLVMLCWWLVAAMLVVRYPRFQSGWAASCWARLCMGLFVLLPTWHSLIDLRAGINGAWLLLWVIVVVAAADTGAYFAGRWLGKRRLAPLVSPGKTIEGAVGAIVVATLVAVVYAGYFVWQWQYALLIAPVLVVFSVIGDLFESVLKRERGIKDVSALLPGHGGALDRLDSYTAAAPVAIFMMHYLPLK